MHSNFRYKEGYWCVLFRAGTSSADDARKILALRDGMRPNDPKRRQHRTSAGHVVPPSPPRTPTLAQRAASGSARSWSDGHGFLRGGHCHIFHDSLFDRATIKTHKKFNSAETSTVRFYVSTVICRF